MHAFFLVLAFPICCLAFISSLTPHHDVYCNWHQTRDKDFVALCGDSDYEQVLLELFTFESIGMRDQREALDISVKLHR